MKVLLDANVLIALLTSNHAHHDAAETWFDDINGFATCPITEGSLIRMVIRKGQSADIAQSMLQALTRDDRHQFWHDDVPYIDVRMTGVLGHRQVTDAYLAQLARQRNGRLATFDQGLARLHRDVADLVPHT